MPIKLNPEKIKGKRHSKGLAIKGIAERVKRRPKIRPISAFSRFLFLLRYGKCQSEALFILEEFLLFPCQNRPQFERTECEKWFENVGLNYEYVPVNLLKGEQRSSEFLKLNPLGYVPVIVDGDVVLADSLAILLYLDEKYPQHPLLPSDLRRKALICSLPEKNTTCWKIANIVASNLQPLQNLAILVTGFITAFNCHLEYINQNFGQEERVLWIKHHLGKGLAALEALLKDNAGRYAVGDEVYLADLFLAPQIYSAIRFKLDMTEFPILSRLNEAYSQLPAFQDAMPEKQPDAPSSITS
ncbi:hypothetical protein TIFTF001_036442 [Ficus carica]|uniref:Glutathione S-transferase n=2 Tax=Ficus carica TaxID=3494 RepID=A0AA88J7P2_FICCA|nr:hypothetical protein TIFTF001_036442 [Ficus carica]